MTRTLVPLTTPDVSAFAKTLKTLLHDRHEQGNPLPSHLELLNLLARAAGMRNFSTLKALAQHAAMPPGGDAPALAPAAEVDGAARAALAAKAAKNDETPTAAVRKALQQFDGAGRLLRLPNKLSVQQLCMWPIWTLFDAHRQYTEKEVNAVINALHTFGDQATLRRELVNMKLLGRKSDCSVYWKEPRRPPADVQALLRAWRARRA